MIGGFETALEFAHTKSNKLGRGVLSSHSHSIHISPCLRTGDSIFVLNAQITQKALGWPVCHIFVLTWASLDGLGLMTLLAANLISCAGLCMLCSVTVCKEDLILGLLG